MMQCAICGNEAMRVQRVEEIGLNINTVYSSPVSVPGGSAVFGYCEKCRHGQLENILPDSYYEDYNLLNMDKTNLKRGGGNAVLLRDYYQKTLERLAAAGRNEGKFLDIGCGPGNLLELAQEHFSLAKGVEPSHVEVEFARSRGLNVECAYFDSTWQEEGFSAFTIAEVLEHLPNPREVLENARRILRPGGAGYVSVPNGFRFYQEGSYYNVWAEHIQYFSINSLAKLLHLSGFIIEEIGTLSGGNLIAAFVRTDTPAQPFEKRKHENIRRVDALFRRYPVISVWGAGVKGRDFIRGTLKGFPLAHVFDSNRALAGRYVADCATPIEAPEAAAIQESDVILLTALEYREEILSTLRKTYGYQGKIVEIDRLEEEETGREGK